MATYMTNMTADVLLDVLQRTGHIDPAKAPAIEAHIRQHAGAQELPKLLRALIGLGAAVSSACVLGFLSISRVLDFDSGVQMLLWGALFTLAAVILARHAEDDSEPAKNSFFLQCSFCAIGTGKFLFMWGCAQIMPHGSEGWGAMFGLLAITAAGWHFYRMSIDRFLSALGVMTMAMYNIVDLMHGGPLAPLLLDAYLVFMLALAGMFFTTPLIPRDYMPVGYAALAILCALTGFYATGSMLGSRYAIDPVVINFALSGAMIGLTGWAAGGYGKLKKQPLNVAVAGTALLGLVSAPGIILSAGVMLLGYARLEKTIIYAGALLMPFFLTVYYYNLGASLMAKSGILVASGAVLLAGKAYMSAAHIGREERA